MDGVVQILELLGREIPLLIGDSIAYIRCTEHSRSVVVIHDGMEQLMHDGVLERGHGLAFTNKHELACRGIPHGIIVVIQLG